MLNKYPLWKYLLILAVLAIGLVYSAPNLYPDDPAIQITGTSTALKIQQADLDKAGDALKQAGQPPEELLVDGEGHGFVKPENIAKLYERMEAFLSKHIGPGAK